jgi:hypothetical protein
MRAAKGQDRSRATKGAEHGPHRRRHPREAALAVPFADPPKTGFLTLPAIDLVVVEVETRDGVVGTGHLHPLAGGMRTLATCIEEMLAPLVLGADASDPAAIWREDVAAPPSSRAAWASRSWPCPPSTSRSGTPSAARGASRCGSSGAARGAPCRTYGSGCYRGLGRDGMIEKALRFRAQGFRGDQDAGRPPLHAGRGRRQRPRHARGARRRRGDHDRRQPGLGRRNRRRHRPPPRPLPPLLAGGARDGRRRRGLRRPSPPASKPPW